LIENFIVSANRFKEAIQLEIDAIRKKFGSKYDKESKEMQDYANSILTEKSFYEKFLKWYPTSR